MAALAAGPSGALLGLLGALVLFVAGVAVWSRGWAQRTEAAHRARLERGDAASRRLRSVVEGWLRRTRAGVALEQRLRAAGVELGTSDFLGLCLVAGSAAVVVARFWLPDLLATAAGVGAVRGCWAWLEHQRRKRREAFVGQLADLARILSNSSAAGLSLRSALDLAATELDDPAAGEISLVAQELRLGQAVDRALENLQVRMPSREVGVLVATLVIQQRGGGDLVTALRDMADTLEARKDLRREVRTIMSGAIFTSYLVGALGLGTLILLDAISPGVVEEMTRTGIGRLALAFGSTLYAIGFVLIRRTTRIET